MDVHAVDTPLGPARAVVSSPPAGPPPGGGARVVLALGHGAGGGIDARDLVALDAALPPGGVTVVRVEQPWRVAGRRVAAPPAQLDVAWTAVLAHLAGVLPALAADAGARLVVGGRSAGARVACRTAVRVGAAACLALAFPLHPPGRPERSRVGELAGAGVPALVVQGERDPFGSGAEFPAGTALVPVPYADHGFKVPARAPLSQDGALDLLVTAVLSWLADVAGPRPGESPGRAEG